MQHKLFDLVSYVFLMIAVSYGVGRHNFYITHDRVVEAQKWLYLSQPPYPWSLAFSKMSIAWLLHRIRRDSRAWAWGMYAVSVLVVLTAVSINVFQLSLCRPLWAVWDHDSKPDAVCMDLKVARMSIYVNSAFIVFTDFALSIAASREVQSIFNGYFG